MGEAGVYQRKWRQHLGRIIEDRCRQLLTGHPEEAVIYFIYLFVVYLRNLSVTQIELGLYIIRIGTYHRMIEGVESKELDGRGRKGSWSYLR
jgi:hypothetical protein